MEPMTNLFTRLIDFPVFARFDYVYTAAKTLIKRESNGSHIYCKTNLSQQYYSVARVEIVVDLYCPFVLTLTF